MKPYFNKKGKRVPGMYQEGGTKVGNFIRKIIPSNVPYSMDADRMRIRDHIQKTRFPDYSCDINNPDKCVMVDQQIDSLTNMAMRNIMEREANPTGRIARAQELEAKGKYRRANRLRNKEQRKKNKKRVGHIDLMNKMNKMSGI
tara:strand:- start:729 stop:1160 length:432 start_codon:yes stop_codon:yes gene_type:complete